MILFESVSLKDTIPCDSVYFGENRFKIKKGWSDSGCTGKDAGNGMKRERQDADMAALFEAILALKTPEECHAFFKDLCTYQEFRSGYRWRNCCMKDMYFMILWRKRGRVLRPSAVSIVSLKMDATGTS